MMDNYDNTLHADEAQNKVNNIQNVNKNGRHNSDKMADT